MKKSAKCVMKKIGTTSKDSSPKNKRSNSSQTTSATSNSSIAPETGAGSTSSTQKRDVADAISGGSPVAPDTARPRSGEKRPDAASPRSAAKRHKPEGNSSSSSVAMRQATPDPST